MGDDGGGHSGFGQGRGGNDGMSGAAMWQIKKKMTYYEEQKEELINQILKQREEKAIPADPPNVLVDAVSSGESSRGRAPLVRHVLVKDLNKVATLKNQELPTTGIFQNKGDSRKAPMGLYAVFDGQSCAGEVGPTAAEFCARNFHTKMLANLTMLSPEAATETYVKAALIKSFHDLDADYLAQHRDVHHGCGAAVALLIADFVFLAVIGRCSAVLVEAVDGKLRPVPFGLAQSRPSETSERLRLQRAGAVVVPNGDKAAIRHPSGALSPVSRSIGDPLWKGQAGGGVGPELLICTPEVASVELQGHDGHPSLFLVASPVAESLSPEEMLEISRDFPVQPRLVCGEVALKVQAIRKDVEPQPQHVVAQICFLPKERPKEKEAEKKEPPAKKAKTEQLSSMRLRHILVRHSDPVVLTGSAAAAKAKAAPPPKPETSRTRLEAEALLRKAMRDLLEDTAALAKSGKKPKNATDLVVMQGKKFAELCRELSECATAKKGGAMCGDLGWMTEVQVTAMGGAFREKVAPLKPGQWSDITPSDKGIHLIQRVA